MSADIFEQWFAETYSEAKEKLPETEYETIYWAAKAGYLAGSNKPDKSSRDKFEAWFAEKKAEYHYLDDNDRDHMGWAWTAAQARVSTQPIAGPSDKQIWEYAILDARHRFYYSEKIPMQEKLELAFQAGALYYRDNLRPLPLLTAALLPERMPRISHLFGSGYMAGKSEGWNDCLDEIAKRINALAKEGGQ